jgi:hypothetical protein
VAQIFGEPFGPRIKILLDEYVMPWQFENPKGTVEECRAYLTRKRARLE